MAKKATATKDQSPTKQGLRATAQALHHLNHQPKAEHASTLGRVSRMDLILIDMI